MTTCRRGRVSLERSKKHITHPSESAHLQSGPLRVCRSQLQETRYLDSARESIGANVAWLKRSGPPLCAWLATQTGLG